MNPHITCQHRQLHYDEACLHLNTTETVSLYSQISECFKCDLLPLSNVTEYLEVVISSVYPTKLYLSNKHGNCSLTYHFSQQGVYGLNVTGIDKLSCSPIYVITPADDVYKPLWILLCVVLALFILYGMALAVGHVKLFLQLFRNNPGFRELQNGSFDPLSDGSSRLVGPEFSSSSPSPAHGYRRNRVKAVDTFRGITITLMIFVNSGGGYYSIFQHSPWNGLTVADVIFPWFIWIMGFSTVMSVKNQIRAERRRKHLFLSAVRRTLTLLVLGILLNSDAFTNLRELRLPGVLQRIAITYFIVASLEICFVTPEYVAVGVILTFDVPRSWCPCYVVMTVLEQDPLLTTLEIAECINSARKTILDLIQKNSCVDKLSDILSCWMQWSVIFLFVSIHTYLTFGVPYENCPAGYTGPGGLSDSSLHFNCTGGFASYLDRMVFGVNHLYKRPTPQAIYNTIVPVDPEGLLGIFTSCFTAFLGVQAGQILLSFYNPYKRISRWIFWGLMTGVIGGWLCGFTQEQGVIPVNKNLWSLSFSLVTASMAFILYLILYLLIDHWTIWSGAPFIHTGRNSILLYFCSCVIGSRFPFSWKPLIDEATHSEYLFMCTFGTVLWLVIACILSRNKVYVTV